MSDADRILADFKQALDQHFGLVKIEGQSPVKPEHRLTDETAKRFADLCREDDWKRDFEERLARIERHLSLKT